MYSKGLKIMTAIALLSSACGLPPEGEEADRLDTAEQELCIPFCFPSPTTYPPQVNSMEVVRMAGSSMTFTGNAKPGGLTTTAYFRYSTVNPGACNTTFGTATPGVAVGGGTAWVGFSSA